MKEQRYFPVKVFNTTIWQLSYMLVKYGKNFKKIDKKFRSSVMMAVTNVNGCRACSYYHTSELLKAGATEGEMKVILEGSYQDINSEVMVAMLFAEHYADTTGKYDQEAFEKVKQYYGKDKAYGILASIKAIMFGNIFGISLGNFGDRLRCKKVKNAKFLTDLYILLLTPFIFPTCLFLNLFRKKREF